MGRRQHPSPNRGWLRRPPPIRQWRIYFQREPPHPGRYGRETPGRGGAPRLRSPRAFSRTGTIRRVARTSGTKRGILSNVQHRPAPHLVLSAGPTPPPPGSPAVGSERGVHLDLVSHATDRVTANDPIYPGAHVHGHAVAFCVHGPWVEIRAGITSICQRPPKDGYFLVTTGVLATAELYTCNAASCANGAPSEVCLATLRFHCKDTCPYVSVVQMTWPQRRPVVRRSRRSSVQSHAFRTTLLPERLHAPLKHQLLRVAELHKQDLSHGAGLAPLPSALARKYPSASTSLAWQFVFPSAVIASLG